MAREVAEAEEATGPGASTMGPSRTYPETLRPVTERGLAGNEGREMETLRSNSINQLLFIWKELKAGVECSL